MVGIPKLLAASLGLFPFVVQATRLFYNPGTIDGWSSQPFKEKEGTVTEVSNVVYEGDKALKMTQTFVEGYTGRYHSEVHYNNGYKRGDELFYGFTFRLSDTWQFQPQSYNIAQFIADRQGAGCDDDDWMPSTMVWIDNNRLKTRFLSGNYRQGDCSRRIYTFTSPTAITAGAWHKVVIQARWKSDNTGFFKMWLDGNKFVEEFNNSTTTNDDFTFQFRVGLYANGWHDNDHKMVGTQGFRQVWFDEVAIGTTFADVDPNQS